MASGSLLVMYESIQVDRHTNWHHPGVLSDGFGQHPPLCGLFQISKGRTARLQPIEDPLDVMGKPLDDGHPVRVPLIQPVTWPGRGPGDTAMGATSYSGVRWIP